MVFIKSLLTLTLLSLGACAAPPAPAGPAAPPAPPAQPAGNKAATNGVGSTPAQRHVISVSQAEEIIAAAVKEANTVIPENIAIVDPSGMLVAFHRMDNAFPGSIDISIKKARTTVLFNGAYSTADLTAAAQGPLYGVEETNGGLVVFGGGLPLYKNDYLIGGIGVSGGSVDQDVQVVKAAVAWFSNITLAAY